MPAVKHPNLVSVVVPCYRGAKYLRAAVESCLRQTYPHVEVIVVDDRSPDRDAEIAAEIAARDPRVRVVRREANGGICRALNSGYEVAHGEFFTRLAQDDLFREDALDILVRTLRATPAAGLAYADMQLIDENGAVIQPMRTAPPERALLPANRVGLCVMWRRAAWDAVGPFDPKFDLCDDYEFFLRLSRNFPLVRAEGEAPFFFRYHAEQGSRTKERAHDLARARVHLAHNAAMLRRHPARLIYWKRLVTGRLRLWATRLGIYQRIKYDGRQAPVK